MALIGMAIYSTPENKKDECLKQTLECLAETVDFDNHTLGVSINAYTDETIDILYDYEHIITHKTFNPENIGTAAAINKIWERRKSKQHLIKMDDDVDIFSYGWVDDLEEAIERDEHLGILSLKRNDLDEHPAHPEPAWRSTLKMLPHKKGQRFIVVEVVQHCMGTVQMYNWRLIDKMGGLAQMGGTYGYDDSLSAIRATVLGFYSAFYCNLEIRHLDDGGTDYTQWKRKYAGDMMPMFNKYKEEYLNSKRSPYEPL